MVETYHHCIFICSNYTSGTRNGLHFLFNEENVGIISEISEKYLSKEGVSMYVVITNQPSIESIQKKDSFYKTINILEGTDKNNILVFDNMLDNQVGIFDLAMLLICCGELTIKQLRVYLLLTYCVFTLKENKLICKEKYWFENNTYGFREINNEFGLSNLDKRIKCTKPDIIMSKFFNSEDGTNLMNKFLLIFTSIKKNSFEKLEIISQGFINSIKKEFARILLKKEKISLNKKIIKRHEFYFADLLDDLVKPN